MREAGGVDVVEVAGDAVERRRPSSRAAGVDHASVGAHRWYGGAADLVEKRRGFGVVEAAVAQAQRDGERQVGSRGGRFERSISSGRVWAAARWRSAIVVPGSIFTIAGQSRGSKGGRWPGSTSLT